MTSTWLAGLTVFFDDYANCLIVGSSMKAVTDKAVCVKNSPIWLTQLQPLLQP